MLPGTFPQDGHGWSGGREWVTESVAGVGFPGTGLGSKLAPKRHSLASPGGYCPGGSGLVLAVASGSGGSTVMLKVCCALGPCGFAKGTARTVKVKVPCWVGVPATIVPAAPYVAGMDMPGGRLPETIVNVLTAPLLVRMNSSELCPTFPLGRTQTPLPIVPPLSPRDHQHSRRGATVTS